jgi:hypothetical protein
MGAWAEMPHAGSEHDCPGQDGGAVALRTALAGACRGPDRAQHGEPEELHSVLARGMPVISPSPHSQSG